MAPPLVLLQDIHLRFGATPLLDGAELSVSAGERVCLVGRNGSGKSTLLKVAAGLVEPDSGTRFFQPGTTVRYLQQEPDFSGYATTLAYVEAGLGPGDDAYRAQYLLTELGLTGQEDPAHLSGGEARRAALARVIAPEPDVLLLDEPTNHLDLPAIEWLESELKGLKSAMVLISHDRRFLETLSRATVWLDRGQTRRLEQGFGAFEAWRDEVLEQEETERHKLDRKIVAELDWLRYGVTARRKRNVRRLGLLHSMRKDRRDERRAVGNVKLAVSEAEASGKLVIEAKHIAKAFGEREVVKDFSTRILRGDRIGIIGPNGAGKTTLIKLLTGELAPDSGTVKLGTNLEVASLDQKRAALDPGTTLRDALTGGGSDQVQVGGAPKHVMGYLKDFLFTPEQANAPLSVLSGGERGRLMLARALALPSNVLVLDEPTNDLDLETLDLLQEMVADYPGTVILVSHDRDFLDRTVSSVIMAEGDGVFREYAGGYSDMLSQRGRGVEARDKSTPAAKAKGGEQKPDAGKGTGGAAAGGKRRLSFHEQHALKTLPKTMDDLRAKLEKLAAEIADPALYARDPARFDKASAALAETQAALDAAEEEWLRLEILKEELEG
ncbi:ATP-binding cassette subfamily F protein uup [Xanthobacter flavus]|uniref:ATP-binding protein Uup n=1 Tax=Xanthobacter flavus TaxID=281 RepID=A0A9W6CLX9_XANFL|nr:MULTISPECIES: ATP-binding cassette domain-containing protein [Xanthobacter]MBN8916473.1 ATP-binding cassette domain-containing protein [Hyphomicrobiales bacterium]MDR6333301.1 ATP-binding cassette subfamily F protein uup [Xanthobacter flavus]NMN57291.1 ATP-binding cassette subfamily F protein uup [Xanthobacter sp. SG618]GLI21577.1 ATP-binding protein [Xanthobacter flavus]